ncbi:MAG TPA: beta-propeller fold lactonase family protein [Candidatus Eremiobacteraceae bacterium]|nr:beta-propeller fold lactonase family protein [Candidatus Eremiobacteraceae bacterium]
MLIVATLVAGSSATCLRAAGGTILPNGWTITPAGAVTPLGTLPLRVVEDPSGRWVAVSNAGYGVQTVTIVNEKSGMVADTSPIAKTFYGLAFSPDGKTLYASTAADGGIQRFAFDASEGTLKDLGMWTIGTGPQWIAGLAVSPDGKIVYAASNGTDELVAVDSASGAKLWAAKVGVQPYAVAVSPNGQFAYVSDWTGSAVDVVNAASGENIARVAVGAHPNALLVTPGGATLYVACANENTVYSIDTATNTVRDKIDVGLAPNLPEGSTPDGLAFSPNGKTLFVADAGVNAIVAIDLTTHNLKGAVPVGWYPTDILVSRDGSQLIALDGHGVAGHANPQFPHPDAWSKAKQGTDPRQYYVAELATGDLQRVPMPMDSTLQSGLQTALENRNLVNRTAVVDSPNLPAAMTGQLRHVIYVIKENRTYDEVLGDDPRGNGDASLAIFGRNVTPNIHRLANTFVLLDNFDVDAEVSADGHNWSTAAYSTDYVDKLWPSNYSDRGRDYDFEGSAASRPSAGYLWDDAIAKGLSVRDYGEYTDFATKAGQPEKPVVDSLLGRLDTHYRGFDLHVTDQSRMDEWLREFSGFVKNGNMPVLEIVRLPDDHTSATRPGMPTPFAMVADNDYALGRMIEALSHSRYWKDTIVFVVEDDAQAGPDHVSDHRAEALIVGSLIKRSFVDSTHYTTSGMIATIEMLLHLQPMSQFDAVATTMKKDLAAAPDLTPWTASPPIVKLNAVNPLTATDAKASLRLNLDDADRADTAAFNRILMDYAKAARRSGGP